jgi:hypothetical protein
MINAVWSACGGNERRPLQFGNRVDGPTNESPLHQPVSPLPNFTFRQTPAPSNTQRIAYMRPHPVRLIQLARHPPRLVRSLFHPLQIPNQLPALRIDKQPRSPIALHSRLFTMFTRSVLPDSTARPSSAASPARDVFRKTPASAPVRFRSAGPPLVAARVAIDLESQWSLS